MSPKDCEYVVLGENESPRRCLAGVWGGRTSAGLCRKCISRNLKPSGVGDYIEKALKFVGITGERVEKLIGKPCGCSERRKKINRVGAHVRRFYLG
jgi:hypothetical protein